MYECQASGPGSPGWPAPGSSREGLPDGVESATVPEFGDNAVKKTVQNLVVVLAGVMLVGCDGITIAVEPRTVTVTLVNASAYPVDGTLYISDEEGLAVIGLIDVGEEVEFYLDPDTMHSESYRCDEIQAVVIADANLRVALGLGPEASSDILTDGDDFSCGDTIVFTFSHSAVLADFDVFVSYR